MTIPSSPIVPVSPAKVKATAPHPNPMESETAVAKGDLKARRAPNRGVAPQSHGLSRDGRPLGDLETLRVSNLNPLQRLRLERGIPVKDMVEVVQALYPRRLETQKGFPSLAEGQTATAQIEDLRRGAYDKTVQSKVEHGNEYGINLRPDAMRALRNRFAPGVAPQSDGLSRDGSPKGELANSESLPPRRPSAARASRRTKPYRVQARLSERVYGQLQRLTAQTGTTMQDFLEQLIVDFLAKVSNPDGFESRKATATAESEIQTRHYGKEERIHGTQVEHGDHRQEDRQPGEHAEQGALRIPHRG